MNVFLKAMNKYSIHVLAFIALVIAAGCGKKQAQDAHSPFGDMGTPEVGVVTVASEAVPFTTELPGRLDAVRTAQVRARATGIILKQEYKEGADVQAGEVLFQIDPAPLEASFKSAQAALSKAQATASQMRSKKQRFDELVRIHAISQQE